MNYIVLAPNSSYPEILSPTETAVVTHVTQIQADKISNTFFKKHCVQINFLDSEEYKIPTKVFIVLV